PGAVERCDGVDADCDGAVDDDPLDGASWYADTDGDGFGDGAGVRACEALAGHVADAGDCDDADAAVHPGADETCDGVDTDCDGLLDVGAIDGTWLWPDADGDGYGDRWTDPVRDCDVEGRAENGLDGDDADAGISPAAGGSGLTGTLDAGAAAWGVGGSGAGAGLGTAVHLDGGLLIVGAPGVDRAYVFDGLAGYEGLGDATATLAGDDASGFGSAFTVGDLDGDGVADLVVGAPDDGTIGTNAGAAFVFAGPVAGALDVGDALPVYAPSSRDSVGSALAVADVDGDGAPDLAVGAPDHGNTGRLYLLRGPLTATPDLDAETSFGGLGTLDRAGASVAAGDLDGDGLAEVLTAAPGAGAVYVVPGGAPEGFTFADAATIGGRGGSYLTGRDLAIVPDVDGDGRLDVLVGGPAYTGGLGNVAGEAWLLTGPVDGARDLTRHAWATFVGTPGDTAGWSVGGGDLDGDGVTELLVGAPADDAGGSEAGTVFVLRGATGTHDLADADAIVVGHAPALRLGED
ncbi:MAG: FG-GAP-like repeat-containing protein, partial [Myxococcota bacterium]